MPTNHDESLLERYQREHFDFQRIDMSEHTKGRLTHKRLGVIVGGPFVEFANGSGQKQIAMVCGVDDGSDMQANARRLVARWNLLSPFSTEFIEAGSVDLIAIHNERDSLRAVNAELLEALEVISPFIPTTSASEGGAAKYSEAVHAADKVRAAIAKARAVLHADDAGGGV